MMKESGSSLFLSFLPHVFLTPGSCPLGHLHPCLLPSSWGSESLVLKDSHHFAIFFSSQKRTLLLLLFLDEANMQWQSYCEFGNAFK